MQRFVRFAAVDRNNWRQWDPMSLTGIITVSRLEKRHWSREERQLATSLSCWFNDHIPCPPFHERLLSGQWTVNCISWWRTSAQEPVRRLRPLIKLLRSKGFVVRTLRTNNPGRIVYHDRWQVVADCSAFLL